MVSNMLVSVSLPLLPPVKHTNTSIHTRTCSHKVAYSAPRSNFCRELGMHALHLHTCVFISQLYVMSFLYKWDYTILQFHAFFYLKICLRDLAKPICVSLPLSFQQLNSILYEGWTMLDLTQSLLMLRGTISQLEGIPLYCQFFFYFKEFLQKSYTIHMISIFNMLFLFICSV